MQSWIRSGGIRSSKTFCTGVALMVVALFSWSAPLAGDRHSDKAIAASVDENGITESNISQTSQPRLIEIDLSEQRLRAWEGKKLVYSYRISGGKRSTPTPIGRFRINSKYRTHRMRGRGYNIPDVPYTMYFYRGYAIHGAYWHNRFGTPVSHGCVNLPVKQARNVYNWASYGTLVVVHK
ncbi:MULTISPECIES: L,D-transpeptidase [unclassified Nostoc]|jgi:lipoprotein-anchoring transpeptidase ErfK/SrfK|uniref:L,D-transpeptidase n=1 Tax=unclassified Nostoc TaxID=2593658 RepID=UPI0013D8A0EC|nr:MULTISPECIES: L,D-transpeptidase [unclassified Nostoc]MBE8997019.1 L,D-transpeptidase [Nostoc sp. LEGE 12447]NEU81799.1 L,D-transpeptidase [Nostoc sp. UIC 10630]